MSEFEAIEDAISHVSDTIGVLQGSFPQIAYHLQIALEDLESYSQCDECGKTFKGKVQFCTPECKKAYHDAYKHHGEDAARIAYEESKYDNYYDFGYDEGDWEEE